MTKEEAIKHLHTYSSTNGSGLTTQDQHEEAKKMAIKALETQPGWIPVTERLPDNDRAVLVTLKWAEDDYEVAVGEYWHNSTASHGWGSFEGHVIAWHELPTPYREGGQDGKN